MTRKMLGVVAGGAGAMFIATAATADFDGVDVTYADSPDGIVTQLYATASGAPNGTLLSTGFTNIRANDGNTFYQNGFGNNFAPNAAFIPAFPSLANDSFVTFNRLTSTDDTTGGDPDFSMTDTNVNGGWFWIPGNGQGDAVDYTRQDGSTGSGVLIAQLTLLGNPAGGYGGTITFFTSGGNPDGVKVDFDFKIPAPGALALLGLAGLAGTRRRRRA